MSLSTTNSNELTYEQVQKVLIKPLEAASTFLACGPKIVDSAVPVRFPKLGGPTAPAWVGELEPIPEADVDFEEFTLMPTTMKSVKTLTKFSNELARQSVVSLDAAIRERLVTDVRDKIDAQFFGGAGDGVTTPRGIFNAVGITRAMASTFNLDSLLEAQGAALEADVDLSQCKWVMSPAKFMELRGLKDTTGRYIVEPDTTKPGAYTIFGCPVVLTKHLPDGVLGGLVDFSQVIVVRDLDCQVKVLDQLYGDIDAMALRTVSRWDVGLANAEAVVSITGTGA